MSFNKVKKREVTTHQRQQDIINLVESLYSLIRRGEIKPCNIAERAAEMLKLLRSTVLSWRSPPTVAGGRMPSSIGCRSTTFHLLCIMSHTVLLIQNSGDILSRTYSDFECVTDCINYVVDMYEDYLKQANPHILELSYQATELFAFIDNLQDLSCLVLNKQQSVYVPYNKDWIKEKVLRKLQREQLVL